MDWILSYRIKGERGQKTSKKQQHRKCDGSC